MPTHHPSPQEDVPELPVILGFFAHPDDETLTAGGALARFASRARVHVITATRGEMGEVVGPEGERQNPDWEQLTAQRIHEVKQACGHLGVGTHEFLPGDYHDSGMAWADERRIKAVADPNAPTGALTNASIDEIAHLLAERIIELRPTLVLTEEPAGGYGHPDHVHCHDAMMRAVEIARPAWQVPFVAFAVQEESRVRQANTELASLQDLPTHDAYGLALHRPDLHAPLRTGVSNQVDAIIDTSGVVENVAAAIGSHQSQVHALSLYPGAHLLGWYALTNNDLKPLLGHAAFILAPASGPREEFLQFLTDLGLHPISPSSGNAGAIYTGFLYAFGLLSGLIVGLVGSFTHRANQPWGLTIALGAVLAGAVMTRSMGNLRVSLTYCLGAVVSVFAVSTLKRGSDVVIVEDWYGIAWLFGTIALLLIGLLLGERVTRPRGRAG